MKHCILSILLGTVALGASAQTQGTSAPRGPEITFQSQEHDYGTIAQGANGTCEFTYTNSGDEILVVSSCRSSCGCVVPTWDPNPLAPGKSAVVKVKYDTNRVGPFMKSVTLESNARNTPTVVLRIKGTVTAAPVPAPTKSVGP